MNEADEVFEGANSSARASKRLPRKAFWKVFVTLIVGGFFVLRLDIVWQTGGWGIAPPGPALLFYWTLIGVVVLGMVSAGRAHDRNKSAWWLAIYALPYAGWAWALVELGFLKGTQGPNRFGSDPLEAADS